MNNAQWYESHFQITSKILRGVNATDREIFLQFLLQVTSIYFCFPGRAKY